MLSMDVVDTLRHQDSLVARELDEERREQELLQRLRDIYRNQGIEVSERILQEGVKSLKDSRFVYSPPPPGLGVTMAKLWVNRGRIGSVVGAVVGVLGAAWFAWFLLVERPARLEAERERIEVTQVIPNALDKNRAEVEADATDDAARRKAQELFGDGTSALRRGDVAAARKASADLEALGAELRRTYRLMIVSRPGERTGVFRVPARNPSAQNYSLVVEAIGPDGKPQALPVTSEEDGKSATVSKWGVRVPKAVYDTVGRDKQDDGIVQNRLLGEKKKGRLSVDWAMPLPPGPAGAILEW